MMTKRKIEREKKVVRFKYDPNDWRRQARMEIQRKERKRERKVLLEQAITFIIFFMIMVWASGVLS